MKKIRKAIAKKFKNWKTTTSKETATQGPKISSREEAKKPLEIIIEQQPTVVTAETTTAKDENSKEVCKYSVTNKDTTHAIDKATGTDTKLCESEDLQPICESNEEAQIETTVEPTSVDRGEANKQEPNASNSPSSTACFDSQGNSVDEKSSKKAIQPIVAGVVGAVLLVVSVAFYALKIDATVALVMGIVGLACISFALYHALKPNTKFEKVESVNPTTTDLTFQL